MQASCASWYSDGENYFKSYDSSKTISGLPSAATFYDLWRIICFPNYIRCELSSYVDARLFVMRE